MLAHVIYLVIICMYVYVIRLKTHVHAQSAMVLTMYNGVNNVQFIISYH